MIKKYKNFLTRLFVPLMAVAGLFIATGVFANTVEAKELTDVITSTELLNASDVTQSPDSEGVYQLRTSTAYKLRSTFDLSAYNGNLENGDYFTFTIPAPLDVYTGTTTLTEPDTGVAIADAVVTKNGTGAGGTVTVTLKNLDAYLAATGGAVVKDVSGTFAASFKIDSDVTKRAVSYDSTGMQNTVNHVYTTKTISGTTEGYENFAKNGGQASKGAWTSPKLAAINSPSSGKYYSAWRVRVNTGSQNLGENVVVHDVIATGAQYAAIQYIPESLQVYSTSMLTTSTSSTSVLTDAVLLTEGVDYTVQWNSNYTSLDIILKDGTKQYWILYNTTTPNDGSTVSNTVTVDKADGTVLTQRSNVTRTTATATATSLFSGTIVASTAYKIKINKTDAFNFSPVVGAVYTVTAPDGSTQDITTDAKGVALTTEYAANLVGQTFKIKEKSAPAGYELDATEYTVTLGASGSTINLKDEPIPAPTDITATKVLTGRALAEGEFSFNLFDTEGNLVATAKNAADGSITFPGVEFKTAGTFTYTIQEDTKTAIPGVTYDETAYPVTIAVTQTNGTLSASVTSAAVTITNTYVPATATATIAATKQLTGRNLVGDEFTFNLTDKASGTVVATATNTVNGSVSFGELTFDAVGTYTYTVSEVAGIAGGMTYDNTTYDVVVTVTDDGKGQLVASVDKEASALVFSNTYVEPTTTTTTTVEPTTTTTTTVEPTTTTTTTVEPTTTTTTTVEPTTTTTTTVEPTTTTTTTVEPTTTTTTTVEPTTTTTTTVEPTTTTTTTVEPTTTTTTTVEPTTTTTTTVEPTTTTTTTVEPTTTTTTTVEPTTTTTTTVEPTTTTTTTVEPTTTTTTTVEPTTTTTSEDPTTTTVVAGNKGGNNSSGTGSNSSSKSVLPSTGENSTLYLVIVGIAVLLIAGTLVYRKNH